MLPLLNMKIILFTQFKKSGWEVPLLLLLGLSLRETVGDKKSCNRLPDNKKVIEMQFISSNCRQLGWDFHEQI